MSRSSCIQSLIGSNKWLSLKLIFRFQISDWNSNWNSEWRFYWAYLGLNFRLILKMWLLCSGHHITRQLQHCRQGMENQFDKLHVQASQEISHILDVKPTQLSVRQLWQWSFMDQVVMAIFQRKHSWDNLREIILATFLGIFMPSKATRLAFYFGVFGSHSRSRHSSFNKYIASCDAHLYM